MSFLWTSGTKGLNIFHKNTLKTNLAKLFDYRDSYDDFDRNSTSKLNKDATKKKKWVREITSPILIKP